MSDPVLVLATSNRDKAAEMTALLDGLLLTLMTRGEFADLPEVDETSNTFMGNAVLKAEAVCRTTGFPALADDSGLCVDALGGAPGVLSARYAGPLATYADNNAKLLDALKGVPEEKRTARFVCAVAVARPGRATETFEGVCEGEIATAPDGDRGFGYDPLFRVGGLTYARMDPAEKARVSHRARAFAKARDWLGSHLSELG
jgi:XTP/dITP diphosphohydrolase